MTPLVRFILGVAALFPAASLLADDGNVRVAVVVDLTPAGRKIAPPTPDQPVYYLPVAMGFKPLGGVLTHYQRPPPPASEVRSLLVKTLADQGYRVATQESPPSLVLVFRWGYIAPVNVMGKWANRDEMMTYLAGDNWREMPPAQELISSIGASPVSPTPNGPYGNAGGANDSCTDTDMKSRYFLMVSALDFSALQQHKSVLLWRAHVSINYWGHYLDEALPTLIAAGAPVFGRETLRPQMTTVPIIPMGHVIVGAPLLAKNYAATAATAVTLAGSKIGSFDGLPTDTDRMLTQLAEQADEASVEPPDLAAAPAAPADAAEAPRRESPDGIVRLPPYIVTDTREHIRWHYAAIGGFEILSCCSTAETENFAQGIYRQQAWLNEMAPPSLQARATVPTAIILLDDDIEKAMSRDIAALTKAKAEPSSRVLAEAEDPSPPPANLVLLPQIEISDEDSLGVDMIFKDKPGFVTEFDPDYVFFLLAGRTPPLPPWFKMGMLRFYEDRLAADKDASNAWSLFIGRGRLKLPPASWVSPEVTEFIRAHRSLWGKREKIDLAPALLPMSALLTEPLPPAANDNDKRGWLSPNLIVARGAEKNSPWRREIWASQAVLFLRWALADDTCQRRKALWKFVERASAEPVTEAMFKDCFGLGFGEMNRQLSEYLPTAVSQNLVFAPETPIDIPWVEARIPTEAEKARILGDWQRKEIDFVKPSHPEYAAKYATQANLTLMRAYNDGGRDPGLLAALGLYECSVGDNDRAQSFLAAAVQAQGARPRAYVELARIRLAAALAKPAEAGGKLNRAQVASVLDLLRATRLFEPPQLAAFLLAAQAWEHAAVPPTPAELHLLDEGLYFFPGDPRLIVATAQLDAAAGLRTDAIRVLDRGLQKVPDPTLRNLFATLRTRYADETKN